MSKTIWKYRLPVDGVSIEIDDYIIKVLHIECQNGYPTMWAVVDPNRTGEQITEIVSWGTGWGLPENVWQTCAYWGTCGDGAGYIWHYFAVTRSIA